MMTRNVWKMCAYCSLTYFSRSSDGLAAMAVPTSDATSTARRRGDRAGIDPAMRSLVHRNSAASAVSISARNAMRPKAIRQYRLPYQRSSRFAAGGGAGSDIGRFVAGTPDRQDRLRLARRAFDLLPQPLHQCIDAADGHERLILPDAAQEGLTAEHDTRIREEHVEQLELVEGEIDVNRADAHAAACRIDFDVAIENRGERPAVAGANLPRLAAAQQRAHSGHQLADPEWLGQVVVRAAVEAEHLVGFFPPRRQH